MAMVEVQCNNCDEQYPPSYKSKECEKCGGDIRFIPTDPSWRDDWVREDDWGVECAQPDMLKDWQRPYK